MDIFPLRSPIKKLDKRIARLEKSLKENRKLLKEIRDLISEKNTLKAIKRLTLVNQKTFESHRHEYKRPEKMKKFVVDETSTPIQED